MTITAADPRLAGHAPTPALTGILRNLIDTRDLGGDTDLARRVAIAARQITEGTIDAAVCDRAIKALRILPAKPEPALPTVPELRYALNTTEGPRRYRVRYGTKPGIVLVDAIGDRDTKTPLGRDEARRVLAAIAVDWQAAGKLYADVTGRCGECHTMLTNPVSIATGWGPVCREKLGIPAARRPDVETLLTALGL